MKELASTQMSSRGQVVIPEKIRKALDLQEGTQFVVFSEKDVVILKKISPPSMDELDHLIKAVRKNAQKVHVRKIDVKKAIIKARKK